MSVVETAPRGLRFALARVTVEFVTAFAVGAGGGDDANDALFVVDCNGLPTLPGTSIAGILRHAWAERVGCGMDPTRRELKEAGVVAGTTWELFGFQAGDRGQASRLEVSWGLVHDSQDRPVSPRPSPQVLGTTDAVLTFLKSGIVRDHVRIDHVGVADDRGKFDEIVIPAGARFTFELLVHAPGEKVDSAKKDLDEVIRLLSAPETRIGGKTRRGYGAFRIEKLVGSTFDLALEKDRKRFKELRRDLSLPALGLEPWKTGVSPSAMTSTARQLDLKAQDLWIFGTGLANRPAHRVNRKGGSDKDKAHDKVPLTESRIIWAGGRGAVKQPEAADFLIPATGIKGALRHRALFHALRFSDEQDDGSLMGVSAVPTLAELDVGMKGSENLGIPDARDAHRTRLVKELEASKAQDAIKLLFGEIKRASRKAADDAVPSRNEEDRGQPGRLILSDLYLPSENRELALQHVSLDRFTQGPMDGLLFTESVAKGGELPLRLFLRPPPRPKDRTKEAEIRRLWAKAVEALNAALLDLAEGRLALGAGANRGHGYFSAKFQPFSTDVGWTSEQGGRS